jgi:CheY-like chemotaxis protein
MSLILVVEDADYLRNLINEILQVRAHDVVTAESGKEAVRLCQERSFDLVITDLSMPDMDGLELIGSLRQSHLNLPVLAISDASNHLLKIATMLGAAGGLEKPFTPAALLAAVGKILGKQTDQ